VSIAISLIYASLLISAVLNEMDLENAEFIPLSENKDDRLRIEYLQI